LTTAQPPLSLLERQQTLLKALQSRVRMKSDLSLAGLVRYRPTMIQPLDRWFRYREAYSPQLVDRLIFGDRRLNGRVLDPFAGSGSTLLAAQRNGAESVGFETNPVMALLARVKTRHFTTNELTRVSEVCEAIRDLSPAFPPYPEPSFSLANKFFREDVLAALLRARAVIESSKIEAVRDLLFMGWLCILEDVSNVYKEGNGVKYRNRKRSSKGYTVIPWDETPGFKQDGYQLVRERLTSQWDSMRNDLVSRGIGPEPVIHNVSALDMSSHIAQGSIAGCVFSPPYCNNFNYSKIFKTELWMGGLVENQAEMRALTQSAIRSHVEMRLTLPTEPDLPEGLSDVTTWMREGNLWHRDIPNAVTAYFLDMKEVLRQLFVCLDSGAECFIVIGNSAYGGVIVPSDLFLAQIAEELGYSVESVTVARHLTTSSQQQQKLSELRDFLRESVIYLRKE